MTWFGSNGCFCIWQTAICCWCSRVFAVPCGQTACWSSRKIVFWIHLQGALICETHIHCLPWFGFFLGWTSLGTQKRHSTDTLLPPRKTRLELLVDLTNTLSRTTSGGWTNVTALYAGLKRLCAKSLPKQVWRSWAKSRRKSGLKNYFQCFGT